MAQPRGIRGRTSSRSSSTSGSIAWRLTMRRTMGSGWRCSRRGTRSCEGIMQLVTHRACIAPFDSSLPYYLVQVHVSARSAQLAHLRLARLATRRPDLELHSPALLQVFEPGDSMWAVLIGPTVRGVDERERDALRINVFCDRMPLQPPGIGGPRSLRAPCQLVVARRRLCASLLLVPKLILRFRRVHFRIIA